MKSRIIQALAILHFALIPIYGLVYVVAGWWGLDDAWGFWGALIGTIITIPLPYGVFIVLRDMDWPMWAAILGAIPLLPNILIGIVRFALGDDSL